MDRKTLLDLLESVRSGRLSTADALDRLRIETTAELGYATVDLHRAIRRGFPEAVYGLGKTPEQVVGIVGRIVEAGQAALVTRTTEDVYRALAAAHPLAEFHERARAIVVRAPGKTEPAIPGIAVLTAGTSDVPVAEEAALTAELAGCGVERVFDVGVAGLHRLFRHRAILDRARVLIVVAGMEGALPSVVAGLTACPVIGVPTRTGYGVGGADGSAALLAMLNSCAGGVTVVNVDNGFGAGYAAASMLRATLGTQEPAK